LIRKIGAYKFISIIDVPGVLQSLLHLGLHVVL
jgi:hypothetical protein